MVSRTERRGRPGRQVTEGRFEPIRSRRDRATARRGSRDGVRSSQIQFFAEHRYFTLMKVRVNRGAEFAPTRPANAPTSRPWRSAGAAHGVGHGRRSTGAEAASPGPRRGRRALRPVTAGSRRSAGFQIRQTFQIPRPALRGTRDRSGNPKSWSSASQGDRGSPISSPQSASWRSQRPSTAHPFATTRAGCSGHPYPLCRAS